MQSSWKYQWGSTNSPLSQKCYQQGFLGYFSTCLAARSCRFDTGSILATPSTANFALERMRNAHKHCYVNRGHGDLQLSHNNSKVQTRPSSKALKMFTHTDQRNHKHSLSQCCISDMKQIWKLRCPSCPRLKSLYSPGNETKKSLAGEKVRKEGNIKSSSSSPLSCTTLLFHIFSIAVWNYFKQSIHS